MTSIISDDAESQLSYWGACPPSTIGAMRLRRVVTIIGMVAQAFDVTPESIFGRERSEHVAMPRHVAMVLVRLTCKPLGLHPIGQLFRRDHTSIVHAVQAVGARCTRSPEFSATFNRLLQQLAA